MIRSRLLLVIFVICSTSTVFSGCATEAKYKANLDAWNGQSAQNLIRVFGKPDDTKDTPDGSSQLIYTRDAFQESMRTTDYQNLMEQHEQMRASDNNVPISTLGTAVPTRQSAHFFCKTTFDVDKSGNIIRSTFYGNNCTSR